jgi:hypothetical protein
MDHSQQQQQQQQPLWSSLEVDSSSSLINSINTPPRRGSLHPTLESLFSTPSSATTNSNNNNATRRNSNNSTKMTAKKKASTATSSSRRRSSLTTTNYYYGRRGHSDVALASSSSSGSTSSLTSSSASGLFRPSSKKRCLRRSISWDVRPPKVHELKRAVKTSSLKEEATATASGNTEDNRDARGGKNNESWYSVRFFLNESSATTIGWLGHSGCTFGMVLTFNYIVTLISYASLVSETRIFGHHSGTNEEYHDYAISPGKWDRR